MGMAKLMPGVTFMELMPMASPSRLTSGPPLLPNVMAASVWMYSHTSRSRSPSSPSGRATADTTPVVTVLDSASGEPSRHHELARPEVVGAAQRHHLQAARRDAHGGEVGLDVDVLDGAGEGAAILQPDLHGRVRLVHHDVRVGQDEAVRRDDEAGAVGGRGRLAGVEVAHAAVLDLDVDERSRRPPPLRPRGSCAAAGERDPVMKEQVKDSSIQ